MIQAPPIYVVDVIKEVVERTAIQLYGASTGIDFQPGRSDQILKELLKINQSIASGTRAAKYPLVALFYDFPQDKGGAYYISVTLPKLSIATLTQSNDKVLDRYDKTFKPILYPIYYEFLRQLCRHKNIVGNDPDAFNHKLWERPGNQPEGGNMNDYLDALELQGLQLTFKTVNSCKTLNS